ncbi:aldehyde dehydrogenase family protein [Clostridium estertheticum]|uniref:Succinate-semialdehyde dehydrogenase n=2 Tax=Clostridium estertheticum TaxID=238834 RepID=A0A1J0GHI5_9CLOT|nr:aldehyde dehydrogenase family protein [Clostridium estertheticum]APC40743.1 succinate-semialdehyde dehydrogenase [Clostridium estertheticum subsp. estertheticum]MBU3074283.1 aldehyde dehydrogenase family protein [Clostridium estertheticum]MBU3164377.1 aldehyde dehydrogenase family protein [Clostridium estertheticum]MBU3170972.1 aldehyde dehydrogenase family protein [Clostridium estertheticum]MBU3184384.1 aldehyde dehydrogenase family protein [Clostridium estertheticum]
MNNKECINEMVAKAKKAQAGIANYNQEQVDDLVRVIGKVIFDNAELLAKEAVTETGMGVYEDKVAKHIGKSRTIWNSLKGKKSVDIIGSEEGKEGIVLVAKPKGVIASITPTTNPIVTPMCNAMFALKGRNSIIVAPHPRSKKCSTHTVKLMNDELRKLGAPENLIQIIEEPSVELTGELMAAVDVVVATGGMGMVRAAYSSGKPAFGVGAGNVQAIIDRDYDYDKAAKDIIAGRKFDNGIICSGEQSIIAPIEKHAEIMKAFINNGAYYIEDEKNIEKFRNAMFPNGKINGKLVGQSVQFIANVAGVTVPAATKVIILKTKGIGSLDVLNKEKMFPIMITMTYNTFEEGVELAKANLLFEGAGHTAAIHSNNKAHIELAGIELPISRLIVNQVSSTGTGGSFNNGFNPSTTLGCGSWGNNSISENFTYTHLINISRIGYFNKDAKIPTTEEIWSK